MTSYESHDTIFAPATAPGRAGVAVVRISGPAAGVVVDRLAGRRPPARYMGLRTLRAPSDAAEVIDQAIVVWFEASASYTGEEMAELHVHGGRATLAGILAALEGIRGLRHARPGEFTRRAMLNGRLDLAQAEGLVDLIDADTELQRKQALALTDGRFSAVIREWRGRLISCLALLEASMEFGEEDDVPAEVLAATHGDARGLAAEIGAVVAGSGSARRIREGFRVALVGPPNVGKSSLLNVLAEEDFAIVSPVAGTTRDVLKVDLDIGGLPVTLLDMAGLRMTDDVVERIGVERARANAESADLRVFMASSDTEATMSLVRRQEDDISVWSKCDQGGGAADVMISSRTGAGIGDLVGMIEARLARRVSGSVLGANARQVQGLRRAVEELELAADADREEICAERVRYAIRALEGVIDSVQTDDILDDVFSRFCIGK